MVKPLASLRLSVILFSLMMVLILAGTLAQTNAGVWTIVDSYFRSLYVLIPFQIFIPEKIAKIPGVFPFPGGFTIGTLLFFNLLAAHLTRFKLTWKRSGIILAHIGVLLLLVGEFVTGVFAKEGNMNILEGSSSNFVEDIRTSELAVVDPSDPKDDLVVVIPQHILAAAGPTSISHGLLPFEIKVLRWMDNSSLLGPMQPKPAGLPKVTAGTGLQVSAAPAAPATGVDGANVDVPAAYITLTKDGTTIGTYLVTPNFGAPQPVNVAGKQYSIELRFARSYKPYTLQLIDFKHDLFVGTQTPRNFSSLVTLSEPARNVDRQVLISMNNPLRYSGETFYQAAFMQGDTGTILQVVQNPGWLLPYISCGMVTLGLLVHFGVRLSSSVRRKIA
jgi:hypothetical protein